MEVLDLMTNQSILKNLKPNELEILSKSVKVVDYNKGEFVYKAGSLAKYVHIICKGSVKIGVNAYQENVIVKEVLSDQDIFGENVFVESKYRNEFVEVIAPTKVIKIPINEFKVLVMSNPSFYQKIMSIVVLRLHLLEERMKNFVFLKAKDRIMSFIKLMGEQKGVRIGLEEVLLRLNMSQKEIALLTDTSRQTVARVLGELKKDNIIHFTARKPGRILIRSMEAL